jgi:hypothetical protein
LIEVKKKLNKDYIIMEYDDEYVNYWIKELKGSVVE